MKPSLQRRSRKRAARPVDIIAYDFETEPIREGFTPRPLYLTAWSPDFQYAGIVESAHKPRNLGAVLEGAFLTDENRGKVFVAWNGNRFDAYFIAAALQQSPEWRAYPYLTRSRDLRGLRVMRADDPPGSRAGWQFLDGMAMLGIDCSLSDLLESFCPELPKLPAPDWSKGGFDPDNIDHCAYAMRDSEALWHAMDRAQRIVLDRFGEPLGATIGANAIRVFQAGMPAGVTVKAPDEDAEETIRERLMRGGFVFCRGKYRGPVWKYDLNQAYCGAMRDCPLPAGSMLWDRYGPEDTTGAYMVRLSAENKRNTVPMYVKPLDSLGRVRATYQTTVLRDVWLTSDEHRQLIAEGWDIECYEHWSWARTFSMRDLVDELERARIEAGPSSPTGRMLKAIGNSAYGKTAEQSDGIEWLIAASRPPGWIDFYLDDDAEPVEGIYWRADSEPRERPYQQPQIAAFITAWVRMQVRRAALIRPAAWLYADTDCVMFSEDVSELLDTDPGRYGAWKIEEAGAPYSIIGRKVYAREDLQKRAASGIDARALTSADWEAWLEGRAPLQRQVHLRNFLDVMRGATMYRAIERRGSTGEAEDGYEQP